MTTHRTRPAMVGLRGGHREQNSEVTSAVLF